MRARSAEKDFGDFGAVPIDWSCFGFSFEVSEYFCASIFAVFLPFGDRVRPEKNPPCGLVGVVVVLSLMCVVDELKGGDGGGD